MFVNDPYKFLGVDRNASDDEIRAAYKNLAIKYDPTNYEDIQLKGFAEEKMKDIIAAYDQIMDERKTTPISENNTSYENYEPHGSAYSDVRKLIIEGRIADAEQILNGVPQSIRDAEWYFLKGSILYKKGWLEEAYKSFFDACSMDPSNREYAAALNKLKNDRYGNFERPRINPLPFGCGCGVCDVCTSLLCADCCCECMGGDIIRCC